VRDLVLHRERITTVVLEHVGPDLEAVGGVHERGRDAQTLARSAHGALEHGVDAQLPRDVADVGLRSFEGEHGAASGDVQAWHLAEARDQLVGHAVREVFVVGTATTVDERKDSDRAVALCRCRAGFPLARVSLTLEDAEHDRDRNDR
jgi:hypothetical protein